MKKSEIIHKLSYSLNLYKTFYEILNHWLLLKQQGKNIESFFIDHGYKKVVIYEMKDMGFRLYDDINKMSQTSIAFLVDDQKHIKQLFPNEIVNPSDWNTNDADVIVVTAVHRFKEIKRQLSNHVEVPIVSLEDVIFYTYEDPLYLRL